MIPLFYGYQKSFVLAGMESKKVPVVGVEPTPPDSQSDMLPLTPYGTFNYASRLKIIKTKILK